MSNHPSSSTGGIEHGNGDLSPWSCATCRRRKVRCDRLKPCSNCAKAHINCDYPVSTRPPRRSQFPDSYYKRVVKKKETQLLDRLGRLEGMVEELRARYEPESNASRSWVTSLDKTASAKAVAHQDPRISQDPGLENADSISQGGSAASSVSRVDRRVLVDEAGNGGPRSHFWTAFQDEVRVRFDHC